eukprot:5417415-Lingulodinium_polyedra.AAC.1
MANAAAMTNTLVARRKSGGQRRRPRATQQCTASGLGDNNTLSNAQRGGQRRTGNRCPTMQP